jgi:uridine kinase
VKSFVIGLTGVSGSGKTAFLTKLLLEFPSDKICLISQDHYYHPRENQASDNEGVTNFDTPGAIDHESLIRDIKQIKDGVPVSKQEYTYNNPGVQPGMLHFKPAPLIIVEGIFVLHFPALQELIDLKIFIDTKSHLALKRRIIRDQVERGYDLEDVLYRFENHVMPSYEQYVKPSKAEADIIIPNHRHFNQALEVIKGFLHYRLDNAKLS